MLGFSLSHSFSFISRCILSPIGTIILCYLYFQFLILIYFFVNTYEKDRVRIDWIPRGIAYKFGDRIVSFGSRTYALLSLSLVLECLVCFWEWESRLLGACSKSKIRRDSFKTSLCYIIILFFIFICFIRYPIGTLSALQLFTNAFPFLSLTTWIKS